MLCLTRHGHPAKFKKKKKLPQSFFPPIKRWWIMDRHIMQAFRWFRKTSFLLTALIYNLSIHNPLQAPFPEGRMAPVILMPDQCWISAHPMWLWERSHGGTICHIHPAEYRGTEAWAIWTSKAGSYIKKQKNKVVVRSACRHVLCWRGKTEKYYYRTSLHVMEVLVTAQ